MTTGFIYLASASPRRRELLELIRVPFRVRVPTVSEARVGAESPEAYVARVAAAKAEQVWQRIATDDPAPVLAADTTVVVDNEMLGKPLNEADALAMLQRLSGRSHHVWTAITLRWRDSCESRVAVSEVRFRATTEAERAAYCRTDEPYDKAGGYAIQGQGAVFIEHLIGSYSSVMGLPLCETAQLLGRFQMPPWLAADGPDR
jgi:septum formation protein